MIASKANGISDFVVAGDDVNLPAHKEINCYMCCTSEHDQMG